MTRTEDRLTAALHATARDVREETLPPLTIPGPARRPWAGRLAPAAAAASVALIVTAALVLTGGGHVPTDNGGRAGPPRYYVVSGRTQIDVRRTATGAVTDRIPFPGRPGISPAEIVAAGGSGGGREFIAEFITEYPVGLAPARSSPWRIVLYSFRLTSAGRVTGFHLVKGGRITAPSRLAVSPDGSKVALASSDRYTSHPAQIVVIDLRTGSHTVWQGGRPGFAVSLRGLSWDGNASLVFVGQWCNITRSPAPHLSAGICWYGSPRYEQVRTLDLATGGGSLAQSRVLLRSSARYPGISQALMNPGGTALTIEVTLYGSHRVPRGFQVIKVPLSGGEQPRQLYQGSVGAIDYADLQFDASGRYLLIVGQTGHGNGWLDHGKLRLLPPQWAAAGSDAW